jgi:hypothetical protein
MSGTLARWHTTPACKRVGRLARAGCRSSRHSDQKLVGPSAQWRQQPCDLNVLPPFADPLPMERRKNHALCYEAEPGRAACLFHRSNRILAAGLTDVFAGNTVFQSGLVHLVQSLQALRNGAERRIDECLSRLGVEPPDECPHKTKKKKNHQKTWRNSTAYLV